MRNALIKEQTLELHLPTVGGRFGERADQAARNGQPHRDYLAALFEMELEDRGQRRAERRLHDARFPHRKRLEDFNFEQSRVSAALLHQLAKGDYLTKAENCIFIGDSGTGKSHLATALGIAACQHANRDTASVSPASPLWSPSWKRPRMLSSSVVSFVATPASSS
ncbi:MAG: ATP-binding protein [Candidatus Dormibacteraceae bacterium]